MIDPYYEPFTDLGFGTYKVKKAGFASKEAHHNLRKETHMLIHFYEAAWKGCKMKVYR